MVEGLFAADLILVQACVFQLTGRIFNHMKKWKELGIMPGGAKGEVFNNIVKSSTNLSSDPVEMLVSAWPSKISV